MSVKVSERILAVLKEKYGFHVGDMRREALVADMDRIIAGEDFPKVIERDPTHLTVKYDCGCEATGPIGTVTMHCRRHGVVHQPTAMTLIEPVKPEPPEPEPAPVPPSEPIKDGEGKDSDAQGQ